MRRSGGGGPPLAGLMFLEEEEETPETSIYIHTEKRPCEDTARRWLSVSRKRGLRK